MIEEHIVDKSEPAPSSTLSEKKRTVIRELVKMMLSLHFIYDATYITLAKGRELGVRRDLSGIVDLFLAYPACNVQRIRNDEHATYNVFDSDDLKDKI